MWSMDFLEEEEYQRQDVLVVSWEAIGKQFGK
jgi:hypothetical protein